MSEPSTKAAAPSGHLSRLLDRRLGLSGRASPFGAGELLLEVERADLLSALAFLNRDPDADLDLLVDVTIVDREAAGFLLVVRLRSSRLRYRLALAVPLPPDDPVFPSVTLVYPAAEAYEREIHDLFGVFPDGHPYLRRTILYPGFAGHPLRRDYPSHKDQPLVALKRLGPPAIVVEEDGSVTEPTVTEPSGTAEPEARGEGAP